jgi:hypothetical protein
MKSCILLTGFYSYMQAGSAIFAHEVRIAMVVMHTFFSYRNWCSALRFRDSLTALARNFSKKWLL